MPDEAEALRRERLFDTVFVKTHGRLKKRGLCEDDAAMIAAEVAAEAVERSKIPIFDTEAHYAHFVASVCGGLAEGRSYYELVGEMPFLTASVVDKVAVVGIETCAERRVGRDIRNAMRLEKLSAVVAILLMAVTLGTVGIWYAIAVSFVVCFALEVYVQTRMTATARRLIAKMRLVTLFGFLALVALVYFGYLWIRDIENPVILGIIGLVAILMTIFVIPGVTMGWLLGRRDRRWRKGLEESLIRQRRPRG